MAREDVQRKWEARVAAFHASGEKVTRWCKTNEVNRRELYTWIKRLNGLSEETVVDRPTAFIHVTVAPEAKTEPPAYLPIRLGSAVIEVAPGFNPVLLRDVVKALEVVC